MLHFIAVEKSFNKQKVIDAIDLLIRQGEFVALLGPSGSGKTTLLKMANHLVLPDRGHVMLYGEEVNAQNNNSLRRKTGYVLQDFGLFPHYTVLENIYTLPKLQRVDKKVYQQEAQEWLSMLQLNAEELGHKFPHQLSGGQQQRVGIARALAGKAQLMLMDEPFSALDPLSRVQIREDYKQLHNQLGLTTLLVTHDVLEAVLLADKIALIHQGKLVQLGTPNELLTKPASSFVKDFFARDLFMARILALQEKQVRPVLSEADFKSWSSDPHRWLGQANKEQLNSLLKLTNNG